jgi:hypothetical protein
MEDQWPHNDEYFMKQSVIFIKNPCCWKSYSHFLKLSLFIIYNECIHFLSNYFPFASCSNTEWVLYKVPFLLILEYEKLVSLHLKFRRLFYKHNEFLNDQFNRIFSILWYSTNTKYQIRSFYCSWTTSTDLQLHSHLLSHHRSSTTSYSLLSCYFSITHRHFVNKSHRTTTYHTLFKYSCCHSTNRNQLFILAMVWLFTLHFNQ